MLNLCSRLACIGNSSSKLQSALVGLGESNSHADTVLMPFNFASIEKIDWSCRCSTNPLMFLLFDGVSSKSSKLDENVSSQDCISLIDFGHFRIKITVAAIIGVFTIE
jgi:hypothetical protein